MGKTFSMYVLTDTHFLSPEMWEEGSAVNDREMGDQTAIKISPAILDTFFDKIISDTQTQYVLITGDLITNGDRQSHIDYKKHLQRLTDSGKKVFVTCATHDYAGLGDDENIFHPVYYRKDRCEPAERIYKTELPEFYREFGHNYADSIHVDSGSYSVCLQDKIRMIAIYDNGNGRSHCGLFDDGFLWLEEELKKAKNNDETVFIAVHHPIIPPWPIYKAVAEFEMFGGYEKLSRLMCEYRVPFVLTGHTHVHGIKKYPADDGNGFYDITTNALVCAKGKMRKLVFDTDEKICTVTSIGIDKINGIEGNATEYIDALNFTGLIKKSIPLLESDWNTFVYNVSHVVNADFLKKHPHISKFAIKRIVNANMALPANLGKKYGNLSKDEIKKLKHTSLIKTVFNVTDNIFSGNGVYPPESAEYKAITGSIIKIDKLLSHIGVNINSFVPGNESVLETVIPFLYNNRTGDDNNIVIKLN